MRNETGDLEVEGERLKARYDERLAQAEAAGNVAKESIVRQAEREKERILNQARQEATSALENVRREVQLELDKERQRAVSEVAAVARDMVSKVLGRSLA